MGKFCQVNSELLPLICVENWFQCTILSNLRPFFFKLCTCIWVDIGEEWFGIIDGQILSNKHRVIALYLQNVCGKLVSVIYPEQYLINFLQTLHKSCYKRRSMLFNLIKWLQTYDPWFENLMKFCIKIRSRLGQLHLNFHTSLSYGLRFMD